jgi:hypothetical protein
MKQCAKCKEEKPFSEFWPDRRRPGKFTSRCKPCGRKSAQEYRASHPDLEKRRYWANRDAERERHLVRKYGLTLHQYHEMLARQDGRCAICKLEALRHRFFDVDHCHQTGMVRGLLCTSCNRMLGHSGDNRSVLLAAAAYLQSFPKSRRSSSRHQPKQSKA